MLLYAYLLAHLTLSRHSRCVQLRVKECGGEVEDLVRLRLRLRLKLRLRVRVRVRFRVGGGEAADLLVELVLLQEGSRHLLGQTLHGQGLVSAFELLIK